MSGEHPAPDRLLESVIQITELRDRDALATSLVATLRELTGAECIILYRLFSDHAGRALLLLLAADHDGASAGDQSVVPPPFLQLHDHPGHQRCMASGQPVHDAAGRHLFPMRGMDGTAFCLLEIVGDPPDAADQRLIEGFSRIYRNYLAILDDSERDTLTGLLNRKTFDRNIARILAHRMPEEPDIGPVPERRLAAARARSHWLAVMDVDHFKLVNDRFGHLYGDEVLLLLARLMREAFRHHDRIFRFGGEEFVLLLEPTDIGNAQKVLDRFRATVQSFAFPQVGQVTVSIGFAAISSGDPPSTIIGNADQALYYAKHHGRNQVCSYEGLVEQGHLTPQRYSSEAELF